MTKNSLKRHAGRGAMWQVFSGGWQALVRLSASTILARVLEPSDFGLFGLAYLILTLIDYIGALGMTGGVIAQKEIGEKELNTCFWTTAGIRLLLFSLAFTSAPLLAIFMKEPRLANIIRVISFTFIFSIMGIVSQTILLKNLEFGKISLISAIVIPIESILAIYLASYTKLGYWALVYPMFFSHFLNNFCLFLTAKWTPKFIFDKESFKYQFRFGINSLGSSIAGYLNENIDYLVIGKFMGAKALGLYEYAYKIPHIILDRVARPVGVVIYPALSKVQDDDESLIVGYLETVRYVTAITFPILGGLAALAKPLVLLLWGEQWITIVIPMQILCLSSAIRCCFQPLGSIFFCKQKPELLFKQSLLSCSAAIIFVCIGGWLMGILGVAIGMLFSTISYSYAIVMAFKICKMKVRILFPWLIPSTISSIFSSTIAFCSHYYLSNYMNIYFVLPISIVVGAGTFMLCYLIWFREVLLNMLQTVHGIIFNKVM